MYIIGVGVKDLKTPNLVTQHENDTAVIENSLAIPQRYNPEQLLTFHCALMVMF